MAIIFEHEQKVQNKRITIPKKTSEELACYRDAIKANVGDNVDLGKLKGFGVLNRLSAGEHTGERGYSKIYNGKEGPKTMTVTDATTIKDRKKKAESMKGGLDNPKNIVYKTVGKKIEDIANGVIKTGKIMSKQVQPVKPPKPTDQSTTKPQVVKTKEISTPNGGIKYQIAASRKIDMGNKKIYLSETQIIKLKENK
jgi:hypothetical protein